MWRIAGRSVVSRCGQQIPVRASTLASAGCLECSTPQTITQAHSCLTKLGGGSRTIFSWPGAAERETFLATKAKLEARLKELEEEASDNRVTLADLQVWTRYSQVQQGKESCNPFESVLQ
eukprot:4457615-Pyramimonas_sp.AAC.1